MKLARAELAALLPHQGAMSLLDGVTECDAERIVCVTACHRDAANPLAVDGRLSSIAAIELAAQAIAAHGALMGGALAGNAARPMHGSLARVRDCVFQCECMESLPSPLTVEAVRIAGGAGALSYRFEVRSADGVVVAGKALVALAGAGP